MEFELGPAFTGNPDNLDFYLHGIHDIFERDLALLPLAWESGSCFVQHKKLPPVHHWPQGFWHIISSTNTFQDQRDIDFDRCRRLHWIRPMILAFNAAYPQQGTGSIRWWIDSRRSNNPRYVISTADFSFFVVVEQRQGYALLITAVYVEFPHRRRKQERDHNNYWKQAS